MPLAIARTIRPEARGSRLRAAGLAVSLAVAPLVAFAAGATVDLDAPAARDALRAAQPDTAAKVDAILADAARLRPSDAARIIRTRYDATDVDIGALLLVSYPARRRMTFVLDGTGYRATVRVVDGARARPADLRPGLEAPPPD
jgi:hypothetical protein